MNEENVTVYLGFQSPTSSNPLGKLMPRNRKILVKYMPELYKFFHYVSPLDKDEFERIFCGFINNIASPSGRTVEYIPYSEVMVILYILMIYVNESKLIKAGMDFDNYNDMVLFHYVMLDLNLAFQQVNQESEGDLLVVYGEKYVPEGILGVEMLIYDGEIGLYGNDGNLSE